MFLRLTVENLLTHKLELLTMQAQKFGEINLMIVKAIFGLLAVYCMSLHVSDLLFKEKIWMNFLKMYKKVHILQFHKNIH